MLSTAVWLEAAQRANLRIGQRRRFHHDCGEGAVVQVSAIQEGLSAYCHRCHDSYLFRVKQSLEDVIKSINAQKKADAEMRSCLEMPRDATAVLPTESLIWLAKAGIQEEERKLYGIRYSPSLNRVCIPVYSDGELVALQARYCGKPTDSQPKYKNYGDRNLFSSKTAEGIADVCVFTEDSLSAIAVGRVAQAYALTGTAIPDSKLEVVSKYSTCILWLDGDSAGIKGASALRKKLGLLVDDIRTIRTPKDPKTYPVRLIAGYLHQVMQTGVAYYAAPLEDVQGYPLISPIKR